MTVCAAFKSSFGVVMCADSLETRGITKISVPKLVIKPSVGEPSDQVRMMFAGAGDGPFIDKLVEKMWQAASSGNDVSLTAVFDRIEDANIEWHKRIWEVYKESGKPEAEILISIAVRGEVGLYKSHGPIITEVDDYAIAGLGQSLSNYLIDQVNPYRDELTEDASLAVYVVEKAKAYVDGCGGETQLAAMKIDGSVEQLLGWDTRSMSEGFEKISRCLNHLSFFVHSLDTSEKDLDETVIGLMKEIHESRAEIRKKTSSWISISPELKSSMEFRYRKIEWPPLE